jgi:hypothetical protein
MADPYADAQAKFIKAAQHLEEIKDQQPLAAALSEIASGLADLAKAIEGNRSLIIREAERIRKEPK